MQKTVDSYRYVDFFTRRVLKAWAAHGLAGRALTR